VPLGFAACVLVSLVTPRPTGATRDFVRGLRQPGPG
jgi:Na+(H+)/acetate symporter ActP